MKNTRFASKQPTLSLAVLVACGVSLAALAGCAAAPSPRQVTQEMALAFKEARPSAASPATPQVPDAWWQLFDDPRLNQLQSTLLSNNASLQNSAAQFAQARAALGASQAALLPAVGVAAQANRGASAGNDPGNSMSLSGAANWEVDVWGRLSGGVQVSQARLQASQNDLAAARLSLQGTLTQTYFSLRAADAQIALLDQTLEAYQRSLELTQNRYRAGVASSADVAQAQAQLQSTLAQRIEVRASRAQLEHALAVLIGQAPAQLSLAVTTGLPTPPKVPNLLPATLLQRRPDIAAAEQRVAAANAQMGVTHAAFFPSLTLSANAGYRGAALADLVSAPNLFWSLGPALAATVLDGGARRAADDAASASADQALAVYRQTVLTALQEVEDNLVLSTRLEEESVVLAAALAAANKALAVITNQYQAGTVAYLSVLSAQSTALSAERSLLDVRLRQLVATVQLLKNIAGRWERVGG